MSATMEHPARATRPEDLRADDVGDTGTRTTRTRTTRTRTTRTRTTRTAARRATVTVSVVVLLVGGGLLAASLLAPRMVDKVTGEAKVAVEKQVRAILSPESLPEIRLGGEGGMPELDRCDGTFTEMIGYRSDEVPPLFAAHNYCGGDIILGWDLGQRVRVAGSDVVYEVVEERHTPKWARLDKLTGMSGDLMVQTCYYGENRMRFLALAAVDVPRADR